MSLRHLLLVLLLASSLPAAAIEPFFAPATPQGELEVRLHSTEPVAPGVPHLVTFGMPFPRGSITQSGLATVRVLRAGVEIPAHVSQLTPWRHRIDAGVDGQSVRVARVQIHYSFSLESPTSEPITLQWGGPARTLDVPASVDPRSAWHLVTSGSFVAADGVFEPDVYAVLPRSWLSRGLLKSSRSSPFAPSNLEARDSPAANDAIETWPEFQEAERAFKNNFYSIINQDSPGLPASVLCPYKTQNEPWLYDRAATMFVLYFRSGFFTALREAVRAQEFYAGRLNGSGFFTVGSATGDTKYAYNESLAYAHWTTGDTSRTSQIALVASAQLGFNHVWTPGGGFWTERHAAYKLLANVVAYEVLGDVTYRDRVNSILATYRTHQDGAALPPLPGRVDGALYHRGTQHGDWGSEFGASAWMSALLVDAVVRAYATGEDAATGGFVLRMARFMRETIRTDVGSYGTLPGPLYAMLDNGADATPDIGIEHEHSLDVTASMAWGVYFGESIGTPDAALRASAISLYDTYDVGVNHWIRPTAPPANTAYRVSPWRMWGWEHRVSDALAFALEQSDPNEVFVNGFESL